MRKSMNWLLVFAVLQFLPVDRALGQTPDLQIPSGSAKLLSASSGPSAAAAPVLSWSTFLGGSWDDQPYAMAVDANGNTYVVGYSLATWGSPIRAWSGGFVDAYVAKLNGAGALLWNTFLGGSGADHGYGLALDVAGNVYVTGWSDASWGSPLNHFAGLDDVFVAKLNTNGDLQWNTFLGGPDYEEGWAIAVDGGGNIYVGGDTYETWGSPLSPFTANIDGFVAKLSGLGAPVWHTFLGGAGNDQLRSLAVTPGGLVHVAGNSDLSWGSPLRPLVGSYPDAFAAKLNAAGGLQWNTFLGSSDWEEAYGIALDAAANVYVSGWSNGTWGSPVEGFETAPDAFAAKLNDAGALVWNTFLGGPGDDYGYTIAAAPGGELYLTGGSLAAWGSPILPYSGDGDAFAAGLDPAGALQWHAFLGSGSWDEGRAVAADSARNIYCLGKSTAGWGSPVRPYSSNLDTFVARFSLDTLWRPRHAAGDFDGDGADELVADFGPSGIWKWDAGAWDQISPANPESMILAEYDGNADDEIFLDLGASGLWLLNGPVWMQWSAANVETMAAGDIDADGKDEVACDFGAVGLWLLDGGGWTQLSGVNADYLIAANLDGAGGSEYIVDFGATGLWIWDSGSWTQLSGVNADYLASGRSGGTGYLVGDFGPTGLWLWDAGSWTQLSGVNADYFVTADIDGDADDELVGDFGATGLWLWNAGSWDILSGVNADFLIRADLDDNGSDEIPADFGPIGFWVWNAGSWTQQSGVNPEYLLSADFDGDGRDEIMGDFGTAGLWLWNDAVWTQVSPSNPE